MNRLPLNDLRLEPARFSGWPRKTSRGLFGLFLAQSALVAVRAWQPTPWIPEARWPEGVLLLLGLATVLTSLGRSLPGQNLLGICAIVGITSGGMHLLGAITAIPFGPYSYTAAAGQSLIYPLPGSIPLLWILIVLTSRGAAKCALRRWRLERNYGFGLFGLTLALIVWFDLSLEPYATQLKHFWIWEPTKLPFTWYGAPLVNFLGWLLTALLIVAISTPFFLSKKPVPTPPEYLSVSVWCVLQILLANACATHKLWPPCLLAAGGVLAVAGFSVWSWCTTGRKTRARESATRAA